MVHKILAIEYCNNWMTKSTEREIIDLFIRCNTTGLSWDWTALIFYFLKGIAFSLRYQCEELIVTQN